MVASTGPPLDLHCWSLFHYPTIPTIPLLFHASKSCHQSHFCNPQSHYLRKPSAPSLLLPEDPASLLHLVLPVSSSAGYLGYLGVNQLVGSPSFTFFPFAGRFSRAPPRLVVVSPPQAWSRQWPVLDWRWPQTQDLAPRGHRPPHPATQQGSPEHPP